MMISIPIIFRAALYGGCMILLGLGLLTLCSCADPTYDETERGVCASEGQGSVTSYNRHGPVTRCGLPEE